jgi:hypothetical protein
LYQIQQLCAPSFWQVFVQTYPQLLERFETFAGDSSLSPLRHSRGGTPTHTIKMTAGGITLNKPIWQQKLETIIMELRKGITRWTIHHNQQQQRHTISTTTTRSYNNNNGSGNSNNMNVEDPQPAFHDDDSSSFIGVDLS